MRFTGYAQADKITWFEVHRCRHVHAEWFGDVALLAGDLKPPLRTPIGPVQNAGQRPLRF